MRMLTGAILLLAAEQAFAHAYLVGFPYQAFVSEVLLPAGSVFGFLGLAFLIWGLITDSRK